MKTYCVNASYWAHDMEHGFSTVVSADTEEDAKRKFFTKYGFLGDLKIFSVKLND